MIVEGVTFQEIKYHVEGYGCSVDHIEDNEYQASNPINFKWVTIEDWDEYSEVTLCHYFFTLGVPCMAGLEESFEIYRTLMAKLGDVPVDISGSGS